MDSIWIGFDAREAAAYAVCKYSIQKRMTRPIPVRGLVLDDLRERGLYTRPTELKTYADGSKQLWDVISDAPMSTEFAVSRFLVHHLAGGGESQGWALFMDCDIFARDNLTKLFQALDPRFAVMCVKHAYEPHPGVKMDGQLQTLYQRKNWSSVMAFNLKHEANKALTVDMVNTVPGRDLHRFCWLSDDLIGELHPRWNYLVGHSKTDPDGVALVHFTDGFPLMRGYENVAFADEWRREMNAWARS